MAYECLGPSKRHLPGTDHQPGKVAWVEQEAFLRVDRSPLRLFSQLVNTMQVRPHMNQLETASHNMSLLNMTFKKMSSLFVVLRHFQR